MPYCHPLAPKSITAHVQEIQVYQLYKYLEKYVIIIQSLLEGKDIANRFFFIINKL